MSSKLKSLFIALVVLFVFASVSLASDIALTSVGQSPDSMMVRVVLRNTLKLDPAYNALMKPADLAGNKILIAVVGGSSKGLGAAGINQDDEVARAKELFKAAKDSGQKILIMHVGGAGRRGTLSDLFITEATPFADGLIVVDGANDDGIFTKIAEEINVSIKTAKNVKATSEPLKEILTEWGII